MDTNNKRIRFGRIIYFVLAILFTLCIATQFYFAAVGIFLDGSAWKKHMTFVHLFGFNLPFFMLITAIIGSLPRSTYLQLLGVFSSIFLMYFTVNMNSHIPWIGPLHVMIAILIFLLSCSITKQAWKFIRINTERKKAS